MGCGYVQFADNTISIHKTIGDSIMEMSVKIKTNWPTFSLFIVVGIVVGGLSGVIAWLVKTEYVDTVLIMATVYVLLISLLLYLIQSGTEIAKKALELEIELEKNKADDARRKEEDKKYEEATQKKREHEIKLAEIANTIKVEVSYV